MGNQLCTYAVGFFCLTRWSFGNLDEGCVVQRLGVSVVTLEHRGRGSWWWRCIFYEMVSMWWRNVLNADIPNRYVRGDPFHGKRRSLGLSHSFFHFHDGSIPCFLSSSRELICTLSYGFLFSLLLNKSVFPVLIFLFSFFPGFLQLSINSINMPSKCGLQNRQNIWKCLCKFHRINKYIGCSWTPEHRYCSWIRLHVITIGPADSYIVY